MQKKLKEIKPGEVFTYAGYEWIKLEDGLAITKDTVTESEFDSACNNYFMTSDIKSYLLETFAKEIWDNGGIYSDFDYFLLDLTADDGTKKYELRNVQLGLLTTDLYRKNRCWLEPINDSWWLATPKSYDHKNDDIAMYVDADGALNDEFAWTRDHGVRPVCKLAEDTPVDVPDEKPIEQTEAETEDITGLIKKWAIDRGLQSGSPEAQMVKLLEEAGELASGINKNKLDLIIDSIGDTYVVLVILCMQLGLDINDCIKAAYEEIKDRKGKMVNGTFVKEEDLEV
jgi:ORF149|nr:MAG TPA: NTP-PPase-like protein [Caudoviricetes sp.]